jgi:hypothetical protein
MAKHKREVTLEDVLEGVDVVGTMLDLELPRLRADIQEICRRLDLLSPSPPAETRPVSTDDLTGTLTEIRELLEAQDRRIAALDLRLSRLATDLAGPAGSPKKEDG